MSSYIEDNFDKLLKKDLIAIILAMQCKRPLIMLKYYKRYVRSTINLILYSLIL